MNYKFDQQSDFSGKEFYSFTYGTDLPEFMKEASENEVDMDNLSKEAFADESFRAYPINSKENTYVSSVHFINKRSSLEEIYGDEHASQIEAKLKMAAEIFGLTADVEKYKAGRSAATKTASPEKDIGYVKIGNAEIPTYSYKDAGDLEKVAESFSADIRLFDFPTRVKIAKEIVGAATEEFLEDIPDNVAKYAGFGFPDKSKIANELMRRKSKVGEEFADQFADVVDMFKQASTTDEYMAAASALEEVENAAELYDNPKVAAVLGDFVDNVFMTAEKVAEMLDDTIHLGKEAFDKELLSKVSPDIYKEAFGLDIDPKNIGSFRDELATMPMSDVALFKQLARV